MLSFNHRGLLVPGNCITSNLDEVKATFLESERRIELFEKYLHYSASLKDVLGQEYTQWINGSFCTTKPKPGDIDLVSFLPSAIIESNEDNFHAFRYPESEIRYGVDAYIVKVYGEEHKNHNHFVGDRAYWMAQFSRTKLNRAGNRFSKGFVEIVF